LRVATLKVARTDPAEHWFVRLLMQTERDLGDYPDEPIVFAVYGRARVMPPYVGRGITIENLTQCLTFVTGPCSCVVRDENPGKDMLARWNWEATADRLAAEDSGMTGTAFGYQEFSPDGAGGWTIAASPRKVSGSAEPEADPADGQAPEPGAESTTVAESPSTASDAVAMEPVDQAGSPSIDSPSAPDETAARGEDAADSFAAQQMWKIGVGLGAGMLAVVVVGFVLLRLQRPG
jgi:hypothetical protein